MRYSEMKLPSDSDFVLLEKVVNQRTKVLVKCKCGKEYMVSPQMLFRDNYAKCCLQCSSLKKEKGYGNYKKIRSHPAYSILDNMKSRCYKKSAQGYKHYGGIGVKICDEWKNSYVNFCKWADNNGYKEGLTIDRIDVNGNYEPSNCRFITIQEQKENLHRQVNNSSGYTGVSLQKNTNKWHSYYNKGGKRFSIGYFDTAKEASLEREKELKRRNIKYSRVEYEGTNND